MSACSVCGVEVDAVVLRPTVLGDWEYRYSAWLTWYFEPGTEDRHRCRLTPRRQVTYRAPEEIAERIPVPAKAPVPETERRTGTGGVVL